MNFQFLLSCLVPLCHIHKLTSFFLCDWCPFFYSFLHLHPKLLFKMFAFVEMVRFSLFFYYSSLLCVLFLLLCLLSLLCSHYVIFYFIRGAFFSSDYLAFHLALFMCLILRFIVCFSFLFAASVVALWATVGYSFTTFIAANIVRPSRYIT